MDSSWLLTFLGKRVKKVMSMDCTLNDQNILLMTAKFQVPSWRQSSFFVIHQLTLHDIEHIFQRKTPRQA